MPCKYVVVGNRSRKLMWALCCAAVMVGSSCLCQPVPDQQPGATREDSTLLSYRDILTLLAGGVTPKRITSMVTEKKVDFDLTPDKEKTIRDAGGDDSLILAILRNKKQATVIADKPVDKSPPPLIPPPAHGDRAAAEQLFREGGMLKLSNRPDEAIEKFRKSVVVDPSYADGYFGLGVTLSEALIRRPELREEANESLKRYLDLDPDGKNAQSAKFWLGINAKRPPSKPSTTAGAGVDNPAKSSPAPSGMLDGVYVGLTFGGNHLRVEHSFLVFNPEGSVLGELPNSGLDGATVAALIQAEHDNALTGRYTISGNQIDIVWGDSRHQSATFDQTGAEVRGMLHYIPACRCNDAQFSGLYKWERGTTLQFFPNGTFQDRGLMDLLILPNPYYDHPRVGGGNYVIRNNTLVMNYSDGRQFRGSFAAPAADDGTGSYRWIAINQITLNPAQ